MDIGKIVRIINPHKEPGPHATRPSVDHVGLVGEIISISEGMYQINIPHLSNVDVWFTEEFLEVLSKDIMEVYDHMKKYDLDRKTRKQEVVWNRFYLYKYLRRTYGLQLITIGSMFGGFDHSSIFNGLCKYDELRLDSKFVETIGCLYEKFPIEGELDSIRLEFRSRNKIIFTLDEDTALALSRFRLRNGLRTNDDAIKEIIKLQINSLIAEPT